ncbi:MAG: phosphoribosylaminoimidazolesuccinocarboxamide synthase [Phycisphaerales bacterium]|nr:MAG: phosphoribosylaminoimidazolesuccinocarboxamide synthase [Phycisphaerales bacterium]
MPTDAQTPDSGNRQGVFETRLRLPNPRRGKVRDLFDLPPTAPGEGGRLLIVASDRLSAFDVVLPTPIPGKGRLLTALAAFWLRWIENQGLARTHLRSTDASDVPEDAFEPGGTTRAELLGRVTIGRRCRVLPVEFVVRGYLEGSGWRDYLATGAVCGHELEPGLLRCARLPAPIFTPATKAEQGEHDENIAEDRAREILGTAHFEFCKRASLAIYNAAAEYALERGIIIADTKFEFGLPLDATGEPIEGADPIVIDEALTPDSSRFWPASDYEPGRTQRSFDKQFVREHLESLVERGAWDKAAPGPDLPDEVVAGTLARYREAAERLTAQPAR